MVLFYIVLINFAFLWTNTNVQRLVGYGPILQRQLLLMLV
jgi:hypothetical protein